MFKSEPTFDDAGKLIEVSAVADATNTKTLPTAEEAETIMLGWLGGPSRQPAARFMKTGAAPRPTSAQPAYKLRQKLDDLDLRLKHPHLDRKWRKKVAGPRPVQTGKVVRGRQGAAKEAAKAHEGDQ
jgi:hypothetical protein